MIWTDFLWVSTSGRAERDLLFNLSLLSVIDGCLICPDFCSGRLLEGGRPVKSDATTFLKRDTATYDIIFADPPYWKFYGDTDHLTGLLESGLLVPRLAPGGWFVGEVSSNHKPPAPEEFTLIDRREYGSSAILLYAAATAS